MKKYFLFIAFYLLFVNIVFASTVNGLIDTTYKYAWGEKIGWVNFGVDNGDIGISDAGLNGYAWSENYGWLNLNPTNGGVRNNSEGNLSGYAWGENLGWVDFNAVAINSSGEFSGTASGTVSGRINFDCPQCRVKTDWRPQSIRLAAVSAGGGALPPEAFRSPSAPALNLLINDGAEYTTNSLVNLKLQAGPDVAKMILSNSPDFYGVGQESFAASKDWDLCAGRVTGETGCPEENTVYTVYGKFYTRWGQPSAVLSASIIYAKEIPKKPEAEKPIMEKLMEAIEPWLPEFLKPKPRVIPPAEIPLEQLLSKEAPTALRGRWSLLDPRAIGRLVFAPLPREIRVLTQKLPQLEKTFSEIGITRFTELEKLKNTQLSLPGLTQTLGLPAIQIKPRKFALPQGVPLAKLSPLFKEQLPSDILFVKTGGELIDFNIILTLTEKGKIQQTIRTIANKPLYLVVKPENPVKIIRGYLTFRSQKLSRRPDEQSLSAPLNGLTASLIFAEPVFASAAASKTLIPAEGVKLVRSDYFEEADLRQEAAPLASAEKKLVLLEFEYVDPDGDGLYVAEIPAPVVSGEYEILTVMDYEDPSLGMKEIGLIAVVDPEGYIYEKSGEKETRIPGAIVSLFWLNSETKQYELWPARQYQQENPQTTDIRGVYSFIVPEGFYYLKVEAPGYPIYDGKPFQVKEGSGVHINIALKSRYWWLQAVDWKTILLALMVFLLLYNFYRDKMREKLLQKSQEISPQK